MGRADASRALPPPKTSTDERRHPRERARTDTPQGDIRNQQHRDQADEPGPDVDRDPRLPPRLQEGVRRLLERPPTRELGQLAQQRLVHAEVTKLLSIRYHQSGKL